MTISLKERLPNFPYPDVSSTYEISDYFKKDVEYTYCYNLEKIIRKHSNITLKYTLNKQEYIEFLDFFVLDLEEGFHQCIIDVEKDGVLKKIKGDFIDGINVEVFPNRYELSLLFIIKQDII